MVDNDKLLEAIDRAAETAFGSDTDGQLAADRARAIDAYHGRNTNPAPEGRSQVVDRSTYETIQWILPSLCRIFANGDDVVEFTPQGPDDEQSARQESDYVNFVVTSRNRWFETCYTWFTDALLTKNAYCLAYWDEAKTTEIEKYQRQTEEGIALLLQETGVEIVAHESYPDDSPPPPPQIDPMTGQPVPVPPPMLHDVTLRRTTTEGKVCLRVLPPERTLVSESTASFHLSECDYFEFWENRTISYLRSLGLEVADDIADDDSPDGAEDNARDTYISTDNDDRPSDPSMREVKVRMIWIRHDVDGDGIAELNYVLRVGQTIFHVEQVSRIPVACIVPNPLPHRHIGLSVADVVMDLENIKTAILRQGLDNLYQSNNIRTFVNPDRVNLDDLLVNRPGGIVRAMNGGVYGQDIAPMPVPFIFPQAMEGLEYMDQIRENRTGTNRYFTGVDQNALNKTATGIQQLSTMAAQRVEQIARIFASGIEYLISCVHELLLKHGRKSETIRLRGEWITIDPAQWRRRTDLKIAVGYGAGNKDAMVARLMTILNAQKEALLGGLPVVQPANVYAALMELTKASDFSTPERFWTDPKNAPPAEPQPDPAIQVAQLKAQSDQQIKMAELQAATQQHSEKMALEKYKVDMGAQVSLTTAQTDAEVKLTTSQQDTQRERELAILQGDQSLQIEHHRASLGMQARQADQEPALKLANQVQEMASKLEDTIQSLQGALQTMVTAKKVIRRGKDGRAEGVDTVTEDGSVISSQKVVRGPDGRAVGTE